MICLLAGVVTTLSAAETPQTPARPNIIFILADDLGIGNVGCYGADNFKTPNIDALAKGGLRMEHCYAAPLCGPSRALLLTGRYAFHTGMTSNDAGKYLKPANEVMMPTVLKSAGYVTGMVGKWAQLPLQPSDWGFDEYLRFAASGKYWNYQKGGSTYTLNGRQEPLHDGEYLPDRMQEFAADFMKRHKDRPFYLYYAMSHVHNQIPHAEDSNHASVYMLPTPDSAPGTTDQFTLFQDNVAYMDKLVGKIVSELEKLNLRENTIIIFAGDNGTAVPFYTRSTVHGKDLSGHKGTMEECGALVPSIVNWPGKIRAGQNALALVNLCDFFPTLADLAGAKPPSGVTIDGRSCAQQLLGNSKVWPREWVYVQLGKHWYDRDMEWKLNEASNLFDMRGAPFTEIAVPADSSDQEAIKARKRLQDVLDRLSPGSGIQDAGDGSGRHVNKAAKGNDGVGSGNQNAVDE